MSRKRDEKKDYLCSVCKKNLISEKQECELFEGTGSATDGDIFGFDPNIYSNYKIEGGRLFIKRPDACWDSDIKLRLLELLNKKPEKPPIGGICNECLKNPIVLSLIDHIQFEK